MIQLSYINIDKSKFNKEQDIYIDASSVPH